MKNAAIIRHTASGRRAFPIADVDARALVEQGKAIRHNPGLYEEKVTGPVEDDGEYHTKVMTPEAPGRNKRSFKSNDRG